MKRIGLVGGLAALLLATAAFGESASKDFDFGKMEYEAKCAACHGVSGRGDGVNKPFLNHSPPDLTVLAKENGGEFPYDAFYTAVDGRVARHEEMPCFADVYLAAADADYMDAPYDADRYMDTRLVAIASHVEHLQVK